jgi:hypothetical protein
MNIQTIVQQALSDGFLTPTMESEVGRICESTSELSQEEYAALDQLMSSLLQGTVLAIPRKQFINIMEELVVTEVITQVADLQMSRQPNLDISDIAAYALNRLPPLYATSEEGAAYQRARAQKELASLISNQVKEGINRFMDRPSTPHRPLEKTTQKDVLATINDLLKSFAPD